MKKKKNLVFWLLCFFVFLLTGCSFDYNVEVPDAIIQTDLGIYSDYEEEDAYASTNYYETSDGTSFYIEEDAYDEDISDDETAYDDENENVENDAVESDAVENDVVENDEEDAFDDATIDEEETVSEDKEYTSKEEVAEYIHLYNHLPSNFITKDEAKELGWSSSEGNLYKVAPGKSIGGDYFGNYEGILPKAKGRKYHECDIDSDGGYRNSKRIVFSNDGLIYYTEDHYETFELLYE